MKQLLIGCAVLAAFAAMGSEQVQAGKIYYSLGKTYVTPPHTTHLYPPTVYPSNQLVWHNTSHLDYVPGRWVVGPFGLKYVPGRYVWHADGHYDVVPTIGHHHHH